MSGDDDLLPNEIRIAHSATLVSQVDRSVAHARVVLGQQVPGEISA
jgi:hypothetical protein